MTHTRTHLVFFILVQGCLWFFLNLFLVWNSLLLDSESLKFWTEDLVEMNLHFLYFIAFFYALYASYRLLSWLILQWKTKLRRGRKNIPELAS